MPFDGLRVVSLESRRAVEIESLIQKQGGEPFVAPSVKERALDDHSDAFRLLDKLERGEFELLVLMTGVGLAFWRATIATRYAVERADAALKKVVLLARGPKPSAILRSVGLAPTITIPEPNTWREVVEAMRGRPERRLAIQEYGRPNAEFVQAIESLGIHAETFALYRWDLPEDTQPLRKAAQQIARGVVDAVLFTSSIQLEHLLLIAQEEGLRDDVVRALKKNVVVASIGPIMSASLLEQGIEPDIVPGSPKMGALVKAAGDQSAAALAAKRGKK